MISTEILKGYFRRKMVYQQRLRTNEIILQEVNKINFREFEKCLEKNNLFSLLENDVLQYVEGRLTNVWNMFDSLVFILFASTGFFVNS